MGSAATCAFSGMCCCPLLAKGKIALDYALRVRWVEAFAKIFLVEPHGGDDAAGRPVDHHIGQ